ncbi:hypothetical protein MHM95_08700 [Pseudoalteromonas sp. CnMc7-15]|uniref:hypothetical protein n=1 Tax=unclassified Pseudoalteromonas TaxID=194690 RepID=UPI001EF4ED38|nr:hypothetical protein [Pseudoalteromonas sp. CnMc7-15]MCG7566367.1 hypothetical protein [Pseudoalteromonas sp. CnMc7-15]
MYWLHQGALYIHIVLGCIALVLFWLPVCAAKGSRLHNQSGKVYAYVMYAVAGSGLFCCALVLLDPLGARNIDTLSTAEELRRYLQVNHRMAWFLSMLSILVWVSVYHGRRVLVAKEQRSLLRTPAHLGLIAALALCACYTFYLGWQQQQVLLLAFSVLAMVIAVTMAHYIYRPSLRPRSWVIEHLSAMLGSGIGVYTAFGAFGGRRLFNAVLGSDAQLIGWLLPTLVGSAGLMYAAQHYRRRYGV